MNSRLSKVVSILAVVSLLSAGSVLAQSRQRDNDWQKGPPSVEEKLARISAALNLNDQQSIDMHVLLLEQDKNRAEIHQQAMAMLGPEICAQKAENEKAILTILDQEQTKLFLEIKEQREANAASPRKHHANRIGELNCDD